MLSTIIFVVVFVGLVLAAVVLWALFLGLGLRWAKVPDVTKRRIVFATVISTVLLFTLNVLFLFISPASDVQLVVLGLVQLATAVVVPCVVISTTFKTPFVRALQAWLPTLLASVMTFAFALLVLRPFLFQGFVMPTNSMAPTLVGQHWKGTCPECGKPSYCTLILGQNETAGPLHMICDNFHVTEALDNAKTVHAGDRFMAAKFLKPRRWDLVVFQNPEHPSKLDVKRLVGLPGEEVRFQDGAVWIDGVRQSPPDSTQGLEYLTEWAGPDSWGSKDRPALLGKDEYFVLGDFSVQSYDSRFWQQGVPGHNPFAVPESYLKGVVTHTYWPLHRLRIHR